MKKFTLAVLAAAFVLSMSAQKVVQPQRSLQKAFAETQVEAGAVKKLMETKAGKPLAAKKINPFNSAAKQAQTRAGEDFNIITEAPEGRTEV